MDDDDAATGERGGGERVRFCLACGQIVAYAQRTCPSCGHVEPLSGTGAGVPCRACGEPRDERLLYCPACGAESTSRRLPSAAHWASPPAGGVEAFSVVLALLAPVLAGIALLQAIVGAGG